MPFGLAFPELARLSSASRPTELLPYYSPVQYQFCSPPSQKPMLSNQHSPGDFQLPSRVLAHPICRLKDDTELDMNQHLRREIPWQAQRAWLVPTSDALPSGRTTKPAPTYQINIQFSKIKRCQLSFAPRGVYPLLSTAGSIA